MNKPGTNDPESEKGAEALIYVVDDEPMLLELAAVILEPLGYKIQTFRDPELALSAFTAAQPRPGLIITDYAMHAMNGLELMRACRGLQPRQKVLLLSGTVDETFYQSASPRPDRFLAKPYQAKQLVEVVNELL